MGSIAANVDEESAAFIQDEHGAFDRFQIGDKLPGNVELVAVNSDNVVLSRNGVMETLYFPTENEIVSDGNWRSGGNTAAKAQAKERRAAVRERIKQLRSGK